ncbi:hypothetical protein [Streptomyces sp. NPDC093225]|uniref:hypothetical protein n=1 Tax=Streptomyces sp. NPDC093225 TaxID=3366034 RepID=UPI0037FF1960
MSAERPSLPPVRLPSEAELARDALTAPLFVRAVRIARWAGPATPVGAGGELPASRLPQAAAALGLAADDEGCARASEAWRVAVDCGLAAVTEAEAGGAAVPGPRLAMVAGAPGDVLDLWLTALDTVLADAAVPDLDDLGELAGALDSGGGVDLAVLDWDPRREREFLEAVLTQLYRLTVAEGGPGAYPGRSVPVPLPVLAASLVVPTDMGAPTDDVLAEVSDMMMRLDDRFRVLEPIGLVDFRPVDEELMAEADDEELAAGAHVPDAVEDLARYGLVRLTPLGLFGIRARLLEAGYEAPAVGAFADKGADALLAGIAHYPEAAARAEVEGWLVGRTATEAAAELLAAARGADPGAPLRRLRCQQALALTGAAAEPSVRAVLADRELGGLARVWLVERGAADVPAPGEELVFWLAVDTIAAQLAADGGTGAETVGAGAGAGSEDVTALMVGLTGGDGGFLASAWRVDHPDVADVLEAVGRMHPDKGTAKEARKAAFKARSRG